MNLSIHLALTLHYGMELMGISLNILEPVLSFLFVLFNVKISKLITDTRPEYLENSSDQTRDL